MKLLNLCSEIVVNSSYTLQQAISHGIDRRRLRVVTPGIDVGELACRLQNTKPPAIWAQIGHERPLIVTVGTLVERKGHDKMLEALSLLDPHACKLNYVIVGDGPNRLRLQSLALQLGIDRSVHFTGRVSDAEVAFWLSRCDLFAMPSRDTGGKFGEEGFGIVYLEANAFKKPVLGGDSGGVGDAVCPGVNGVLVNPENAQTIARAIDQLLSDPSRRESLGRSGYRRVVEEFSWPARVEAILGTHPSGSFRSGSLR